jgi:hypothetical protein
MQISTPKIVPTAELTALQEVSMRKTTDGYQMRAAIVRRWNQEDECWEWAVEFEPYTYIGYITEDSGEAPWAWRVEATGGAAGAVARSIAGNRVEQHHAKIYYLPKDEIGAVTGGANAIGDLYQLPGDLWRFQLYALEQAAVPVCLSGVFEDMDAATATARSQYAIMIGAAKCPT